MSNLVKIQVVENHAPYKAGDICGVEKEKADELVKAGIAKMFGSAPRNKMVSKPSKTKKVAKRGKK